MTVYTHAGGFTIVCDRHPTPTPVTFESREWLNGDRPVSINDVPAGQMDGVSGLRARVTMSCQDCGDRLTIRFDRLAQVVQRAEASGVSSLPLRTLRHIL